MLARVQNILEWGKMNRLGVAGSVDNVPLLLLTDVGLIPTLIFTTSSCPHFFRFKVLLTQPTYIYLGLA